MSKSDMPDASGESKASEALDHGLWYKRYPTRFRKATSHMPFELRAAYGLVIDFYYENGGPLRDDDKWIAHGLFLDVRKWRAIRQKLFEHGKLYIGPDKLIHNVVADDLLAERDASMAQEKRKRSKRDVHEIPPYIPPQMSPQLKGGLGGDFSKSANEIKQGTPQSKKESRTEEKDTPTTNVIHLGKEIASRARTAPEDNKPDAASVLADEDLIFDLMNWSGDDRAASVRWLRDLLAQYGESIVRSSYTKLKRDIRDGVAGVRKPVISPIGVWPSIAERKHQDRMRRDPDRPRADAKADFKKKYLKPKA